jgi:hypothetical protein
MIRFTVGSNVIMLILSAAHTLVIKVSVKCLYSIIAHISIVNEKIWIYVSNIDMNLEEDLIEQGVSKEDIILGRISPSRRQALGYTVS